MPSKNKRFSARKKKGSSGDQKSRFLQKKAKNPVFSRKLGFPSASMRLWGVCKLCEKVAIFCPRNPPSFSSKITIFQFRKNWQLFCQKKGSKKLLHGLHAKCIALLFRVKSAIAFWGARRKIFFASRRVIFRPPKIANLISCHLAWNEDCACL